MAILGTVATALFGGLFGLGVKALGLGGGSKPVQPLTPAMRDDAAAVAARDDELRRRKGAAADLVNGTGGAEASAGQTGRLVLGS